MLFVRDERTCSMRLAGILRSGNNDSQIAEIP